METLEDISRQFEEHKDRYSAVFDPETGKVISVGPTVCFEDKINKIDLDKEMAEDILSAKIHISNCFVDIESGSLEIAEIKSIRKIDDVLHRIPLKEYSDSKNPDIFITYNSKNRQIKFELNKQLGGTKKTQSNKKRTVYWSGETVMDFYITKYNDPHWILHKFDVKIQELGLKAKTFKNLEIPGRFSVFTRRILKNYVLEIK